MRKVNEETLSLSVPVRCVDMNTVRDQVGVAALRAGLGASKLADFVLAASELIANACEYGSSPHVEVSREVDRVKLAVSNRSALGHEPAPSNWTMPNPTSTTGRGLAVVSALAEEMLVESESQRVVITAYFLASALETASLTPLGVSELPSSQPMTASRLSVSETSTGQLQLSGILDAHTAASLQSAINTQGLSEDVTLDMRAVEFIDSSGLRVLVATHTELDDAGNRLVLQGLSEAVARLVEITGLSDHLNIVD